MAADGHLVALPDELRALIYFSHPMAAFGQELPPTDVRFRPEADAHGRPLSPHSCRWRLEKSGQKLSAGINKISPKYYLPSVFLT